jgi:hypothetical protein
VTPVANLVTGVLFYDGHQLILQGQSGPIMVPFVTLVAIIGVHPKKRGFFL